MNVDYLHAHELMLIALQLSDFLFVTMFVGSKLGDNRSALKDKYETAEQAMQKKWHKYCAQGEFLLTTLLIVFLRLSCCVNFQHCLVMQTAILEVEFT